MRSSFDSSSLGVPKVSNRDQVVLSVLAIGLVVTVFLSWSALFVHRYTFTAVDGHRYYCLFDDALISMRSAYLVYSTSHNR